jgi:hypothetical protein
LDKRCEGICKSLEEYCAGRMGELQSADRSEPLNGLDELDKRCEEISEVLEDFCKTLDERFSWGALAAKLVGLLRV